MHPRYYHCLFIGSVLLAFFLSGAFSALAGGSSTDDIEDLLGIMESPTKRDAFTKNLKGLLEAKRAVEADKKKEGAGEKGEQMMILCLVFDYFDQISRDIQKETIALGLHDMTVIEEFGKILISTPWFWRMWSIPGNVPKWKTWETIFSLC